MTKLKFHNDDVNTIFNISRFIFDENMIKSLIYTKKKYIIRISHGKALEELDLDADFAKPLYDFVLKHIDLSETDIIQKYLEM